MKTVLNCTWTEVNPAVPIANSAIVNGLMDQLHSIVGCDIFTPRLAKLDGIFSQF